jgi:hypothetical protein
MIWEQNNNNKCTGGYIMAENKWRCRAEDLKGTETEKNLLAAE